MKLVPTVHYGFFSGFLRCSVSIDLHSRSGSNFLSFYGAFFSLLLSLGKQFLLTLQCCFLLSQLSLCLFVLLCFANLFVWHSLRLLVLCGICTPPLDIKLQTMSRVWV